VEVRICDAQSSAAESTALSGLIVALVAQTAIDLDAGRLDRTEPLADREIEENLWRAIRYGMEGKLVDFRAGREIEARRALDQLVERTAEARGALGIEVGFPDVNGAVRQREMLASGATIEDAYRESVRSTIETYSHRRAPAE
jgi:carboxylate-amine ligase